MICSNCKTVLSDRDMASLRADFTAHGCDFDALSSTEQQEMALCEACDYEWRCAQAYYESVEHDYAPI